MLCMFSGLRNNKDLGSFRTQDIAGLDTCRQLVYKLCRCPTDIYTVLMSGSVIPTVGIPHLCSFTLIS